MTTTADTILAIDLGRFKSVACVYSRSSRGPRHILSCRAREL